MSVCGSAEDSVESGDCVPVVVTEVAVAGVSE